MRVGGDGRRPINTKKLGWGCCCFCVLLVAFIILAATSLGAVSPIEYALKQNNFNKVVSKDHTYGPGRYWIWPWCSFLKFPSTVQTMEFSDKRGADAVPLQVKTTDKLEVELHLSFQYQLFRNEVGQLYTRYGKNYDRQFRQLAKTSILEACSELKASDYWTKRHILGSKMERIMTPEIKTAHANITGLQILLINLPLSYENTIKQKQVVKQSSYTAENEKQAATMRADIDVMISGYQKIVTVTQNNATAQGMQLIKEAEAKAMENKLDAENDALDMVKKTLGLTNEGLVEYNRLFSYQQVADATLLFGVDNTVAVLNPGKSKAEAHLESCAPAERHLSSPPAVSADPIDAPLDALLDAPIEFARRLSTAEEVPQKKFVQV